MKVLYAFATLAALASAAYQNVTVKNLRLFDGNTEFFIKSICYSPAPAGYAFGNPTEGSGVCSLRQQYALSADQHDLVSYSACYYEDFFDGSVDPNGKGNQQGWFKDIWTRDLPVMQAAGANVVRFYHTNPITKDLVYSDAGYKYKGYGSDYRPFMDACLAHGMKVVFPLFAELTQILNFPQAKMEEYVRSLVDNVGGHDALLMWQFGNELPLSVQDNNLGPTIIAKLNHFFDYARSYTFKRWMRHVPISIALVDLPSWYNTLSRDLKVDIITTNAGYRGPTYSDLWFGAPSQGFDGLHSLSCETGKPVFIGEIGQHSTDGYVNSNTWFQDNWNALLDNYKNGAVGGALFEYSDESWKAENQRHMGIVHLESDTAVTLKTSGGAYDYNAVKQAFAKDVFALAGRQPFTLQNVDNSACAAFPQFAAKTGPIYPFVDIGNPSTTPPSTVDSNPAPTSNNGGNSGTTGNTGGNPGTSACGAGLSQCDKACYKAAEYCCVNGNVLYPTGNAACTAAPSTGNSGSSTGNSGSSTGNSGASSNTGASTGNSGSSTGNSGASSGSSSNNTPATSNNSGNTGNSGASTTTVNNGNSGNNGNNGSNDNGAQTGVERDGNSASKIFAVTLTLLALIAVV